MKKTLLTLSILSGSTVAFANDNMMHNGVDYAAAMQDTSELSVDTMLEAFDSSSSSSSSIDNLETIIESNLFSIGDNQIAIEDLQETAENQAQFNDTVKQQMRNQVESFAQYQNANDANIQKFNKLKSDVSENSMMTTLNDNRIGDAYGLIDKVAGDVIENGKSIVQHGKSIATNETLIDENYSELNNTKYRVSALEEDYDALENAAAKTDANTGAIKTVLGKTEANHKLIVDTKDSVEEVRQGMFNNFTEILKLKEEVKQDVALVAQASMDTDKLVEVVSTVEHHSRLHERNNDALASFAQSLDDNKDDNQANKKRIEALSQDVAKAQQSDVDVKHTVTRLSGEVDAMNTRVADVETAMDRQADTIAVKNAELRRDVNELTRHAIDGNKAVQDLTVDMTNMQDTVANVEQIAQGVQADRDRVQSDLDFLSDEAKATKETALQAYSMAEGHETRIEYSETMIKRIKRKLNKMFDSGTTMQSRSMGVTPDGTTSVSPSVNAHNIEMNTKSIDDNAKIVEQNGKIVDAINAKADKNVEGIADNKVAIRTNGAAVEQLRGVVSTNGQDIALNRDAINGNANNINMVSDLVMSAERKVAHNGKNIVANAAAIDGNAANVASNTAQIKDNAAATTTVHNMAVDNTKAIDSVTVDVADNSKAIAINAQAIIEDEKRLDDLAVKTKKVWDVTVDNMHKIDDNVKAIESTDVKVTDNTKKIDTNTTAIATNAAGVEKAQATAVTARDRADRNLQRIAVNTSSIGHVEAYAGQNRESIKANATNIVSNAHRISYNDAQIKLNRAEIGEVKTGLNDLRGNFEAMAKDYREYKGQTNSAIAGLTAMTQLSGPNGIGNFNAGAAVGGYEGEHSLAIGVGYRPNENWTLRAGASINEKASSTYGASASYEW